MQTLRFQYSATLSIAQMNATKCSLLVAVICAAINATRASVLLIDDFQYSIGGYANIDGVEAPVLGGVRGMFWYNGLLGANLTGGGFGSLRPVTGSTEALGAFSYTDSDGEFGMFDGGDRWFAFRFGNTGNATVTIALGTEDELTEVWSEAIQAGNGSMVFVSSNVLTDDDFADVTTVAMFIEIEGESKYAAIDDFFLVPEPVASAVLVALSLAGLAAYRRLSK